MKVNSVGSISFSGKKQHAKKMTDKSDYYRWVSQNQANDALKMCSGREVEDGKYKTAGAVATLAGLVGTIGSVIASCNVNDKMTELSAKLKDSVTESQMHEAKKTFSNLLKKSSIASGVMLASAVSLGAGMIINEVNKNKAEKTAEERGFFTEKDKRSFKSCADLYAATDIIYNTHVNSIEE